MLAEIQDQLSNGISLCLILPRPSDLAGFQLALGEQLEIRNHFRTDHVNLPSLAAINHWTIQKAIGVDDIQPDLDLALISELLPDVIFLGGFSEISEQLQKDAIKLLNGWSQACHATSCNKSLCLLVSGNQLARIAGLKTDIRLKRKFVIGVPSVLETQLLCRLQWGASFDAEAQWRETIISSVAAGDLVLCQACFDKCDSDYPVSIQRRQAW